MRERWDAQAHGEWRRSVWAEAADSEESFRASGERDYKKYVGQFLETAEIYPGGLVALEIGCGGGRVSEFIAGDFRGLLALDVSREILRIARKRVPANNVLWLCNDGLGLDAVGGNSVDFIFSLGVFQQIPDAAAIAGYIAEAGRVLKPGGWFVFQVMNQPHVSLGSWTASFFVSARFHVPRIRIYKPDVLDACPIRMGTVFRASAQSGLEVVRVLHRFTQNTWVWVRKKS